jgi:hypothetical protein
MAECSIVHGFLRHKRLRLAKPSVRAKWTHSLLASKARILFPCSGEEGWQNQEVLDAAYRSLKSRRAETVTVVGKER